MSELDGIGGRLGQCENLPNNQGGISSPLDRQVGGDWYKNLAIQPIEYCQKNNLNMAESGVVKYVTRHKYKGGEEDIHKAIHLLEILLDIEYPQNKNPALNKGMT